MISAPFLVVSPKSFILALLFPIAISAKQYNFKDLSIDLNEDEWYIFTRDNIKDNEVLEKLGITYEYMNNFFNTNNTYLDAITFLNEEEYLEMFVAAKDTYLDYNLHKYSDDDLKDLEEEFISKTNPTEHGIYNTGKYKYIYQVYNDEKLNLNVIDYYTVINSKAYTIKFQKVNEFTSDEKSIIKEIIGDISFKLDSKYENKPKSNSFNFMEIIIYAVVGGLVGGIVSLITKKKNKKV